MNTFYCQTCRHYNVEGVTDRCEHEKNITTNYLGKIYKKAPYWRNPRGKCKDYKRKEENE